LDGRGCTSRKRREREESEYVSARVLRGRRGVRVGPTDVLVLQGLARVVLGDAVGLSHEKLDEQLL
jgi:hypothetical protein